MLLTEHLEPDDSPHAEADENEGDADDLLPVAGGLLVLGDGLAEGVPVEGFLLLHRHLLPVTRLLGPDLGHLGRLLTEPDGGERRLQGVAVHLHTVQAVAHNLISSSKWNKL